MTSIPALVLAASLLVIPPDPEPGLGPAPDPGMAVIVGGGLSADNGAIWTAILAGRRVPGPVCVIPAASADPAASGRSAAERFRRWGGADAARVVDLSTEAPEQAHDPEIVDTLASCGGFHFTGGVQSRIVAVLAPEGVETPALEAIRDRHAEGAVVAGSSAGAAIMSDPMIAGGSSVGALVSGLDGGVSLEPGLGFVEVGLMDQHFLARGRIGRLAVAVLEVDGVDTGFGVDEDTALIVDGTEVRVVGRSGVVVVDAESAPSASEPTTPGGPTVRTVRLHLLGDGDRMDLRTGQPTPASGKATFPGPPGVPGAGHDADDEEPSPGDDPAGILQRWTFLHELHLLATGDGTPRHHTPLEEEAAGHRLVVEPAPGFRAWARDGLPGAGGAPATGPRGTPGGLGMGPVLLHLVAPAAAPGDEG